MYLITIDNGLWYSDNKEYLAGYVDTLEETNLLKSKFSGWVRKYKKEYDKHNGFISYEEEIKFLLKNPPPFMFQLSSEQDDILNWEYYVSHNMVQLSDVVSYNFNIKPLKRVSYGQIKSSQQ